MCVKAEHPLRNDFTIIHNKKLYQVMDKITAQKVEVQERVNGQILFVHRDRRLKYQEVTARPKKVVEQVEKVKMRSRYIPPKDAPWRRFNISAKSLKRKESAFT